MKKVYQAPKMIVVLSHRPQILSGSGGVKDSNPELLMMMMPQWMAEMLFDARGCY